jgi:hypothetical protein
MMGRTKWGLAVLLVLFIVSASLVVVFSCNGIERTSPKPEKVTQALMSVASVQPLDDPGSPYFNQYGEGDFWTIEHAKEITTGYDAQVFERNGYGSEYDNFMIGFIDKARFLIPRLSYIAEFHQMCREGKLEEFCDGKFVIYALGNPDKDFIDRVHSAAVKVYAHTYPEIPGWLAANPPISALFLPNGDYVTEGLLGSYTKLQGDTHSEVGCCGGKSDENSWCLYNASGILQATTRKFWFDLYFYKADHPYDLDQCYRERRSDGYVIYRTYSSDEIVAVFDYDGTDLHLKSEPSRRSALPFASINAPQLLELYEAQNANE